MNINFEQIVNDYYQDLYRFGLSLSGNTPDASDLVQHAFIMWAERGHQLRKADKVKSWLFTTLYREFLKSRRRHDRFPHFELSDVESELPTVAPDSLQRVEAGEVMEALGQIDEVFRVPLSLYYIADQSYAEIAETLDVPIGTVMSRISRGKQQLRNSLAGLSAEQEQLSLQSVHKRENS